MRVDELKEGVMSLLDSAISLTKKAFGFCGGAVVGASVTTALAKSISDDKKYYLRLEEIRSNYLIAELQSAATVQLSKIQANSEFMNTIATEAGKTIRSIIENKEAFKFITDLFNNNIEKQNKIYEIKAKKRALSDEAKFLNKLKIKISELMTINYLASVDLKNISFNGICVDDSLDIIYEGKKITVLISMIKAIVKSDLQKKIFIFLADNSVIKINETDTFLLNFVYSQGNIQLPIGSDLNIIIGVSKTDANTFVNEINKLVNEHREIFSDPSMMEEVKQFVLSFKADKQEFNEQDLFAKEDIENSIPKNLVKINFGNTKLESFILSANQFTNPFYSFLVEDDFSLYEEIYFVFSKCNVGDILKNLKIFDKSEIKNLCCDYCHYLSLVNVKLDVYFKYKIVIKVLKEGECWNKIKKDKKMFFICNYPLEIFGLKKIEQKIIEEPEYKLNYEPKLVSYENLTENITSLVPCNIKEENKFNYNLDSEIYEEIKRLEKVVKVLEDSLNLLEKEENSLSKTGRNYKKTIKDLLGNYRNCLSNSENTVLNLEKIKKAGIENKLFYNYTLNFSEKELERMIKNFGVQFINNNLISKKIK